LDDQLENTETQEQLNNETPEIKDPKAVLDALDRAKADAKRFREEKEALEESLNSKDQKIAEYSGKLLRDQVKRNINDLNLTNSDRILKYVDFNKLEFDDNFNVIGLDEQIKGLKEDFPELFDPKLLVGGKADSADANVVNAKLTVSEMQARMLLGK
jgi:hypothetical protein